MRTRFTLLFIGFAATVSGCAAHPDPIIDMKGVDQEQFVQDWNECEAYTEEVQISKGVAKGAGLGAAIGAVYDLYPVNDQRYGNTVSRRCKLVRLFKKRLQNIFQLRIACVLEFR